MAEAYMTREQFLELYTSIHRSWKNRIGFFLPSFFREKEPTEISDVCDHASLDTVSHVRESHDPPGQLFLSDYQWHFVSWASLRQHSGTTLANPELREGEQILMLPSRTPHKQEFHFENSGALHEVKSYALVDVPYIIRASQLSEHKEKIEQMVN
ncbi:MAG: hypothetical protein ABIH34_06995 [Nanoarchaeota archaeon]